MRNISFDNPYWLFILIPLAVGVLIPFFISIRKDNRSKSVIASLILHILILVLVGLGVAGTVITTVMTKTEVWVVADLSYSANKSTEDIDRYLAEIRENLPNNSRLGVICFGKDYAVHTALGEELTSVKDAKVDQSATDIASAVEYAGTLFSEDAIKRVILITDGRETVNEDVSGMVAAVEGLVARNIAIDAIYLDSNLGSAAREAQLTGVDFNAATYLNHETTADALVQVSFDTRGIVSLYRDGKKLIDRAVELTQGYNVINFALPTDEAGAFDYELRVSVEGDESSYNNQYSFTQTVSGDIRVLMVTSQKDDIAAAHALFGERAQLDVVMIADKQSEFKAAQEQFKDTAGITLLEDPKKIPCSVEALCLYDEFLLSNVDIREGYNVSAFIQSVETVVSQYGKSLVTVGDAKIQNKTDESLKSLEDMLPVKFGNSAQDPKLYTIVIDVSRSMFTASRLSVAKQAAIYLLSLLNDEDDVIVVTFAGTVDVLQNTTKASNREDIARKIMAIDPEQGTSVGGGLAAAIEKMLAQGHDQKQVMLISDGMNYTAEKIEINGEIMSVVQIADYMYQNDVYVSTMNPYNTDATGTKLLKDVANAAGGSYYYIKGEEELEKLFFAEIADDITESVIEKETPVHIELPLDDVVAGIPYLPSIYGYVHSKAKVSADTVLTVDYEKASGKTVEVPLYAYWKYGNGQVASFTSSLSGDWVKAWQGDAGQGVLANLFEANIPEEKHDTPYTVSVEYDGIYTNVEIIPAILSPETQVDVTVTSPDGKSRTERLAFDASRYFYRFEAPMLGKYTVAVTYTAKNGVFASQSDFYISYSPEYDRFANFDASMLYAAIRHRGTVTEDAIPSLSNDDSRVATYRLTFTVPFMIAAVALYVLDIIIRKIKWNDIRGLFKRSSARS